MKITSNVLLGRPMPVSVSRVVYRVRKILQGGKSDNKKQEIAVLFHFSNFVQKAAESDWRDTSRKETSMHQPKLEQVPNLTTTKIQLSTQGSNETLLQSR